MNALPPANWGLWRPRAQSHHHSRPSHLWTISLTVDNSQTTCRDRLPWDCCDSHCQDRSCTWYMGGRIQEVNVESLCIFICKSLYPVLTVNSLEQYWYLEQFSKTESSEMRQRPSHYAALPTVLSVLWCVRDSHFSDREDPERDCTASGMELVTESSS